MNQEFRDVTDQDCSAATERSLRRFSFVGAVVLGIGALGACSSATRRPNLPPPEFEPPAAIADEVSPLSPAPSATPGHVAPNPEAEDPETPSAPMAPSSEPGSAPAATPLDTPAGGTRE